MSALPLTLLVDKSRHLPDLQDGLGDRSHAERLRNVDVLVAANLAFVPPIAAEDAATPGRIAQTETRFFNPSRLTSEDAVPKRDLDPPLHQELHVMAPWRPPPCTSPDDAEADALVREGTTVLMCKPDRGPALGSSRRSESCEWFDCGTLSLSVLEKMAILLALDEQRGNRTRAAGSLGISVRTLQRKIKSWQAAGAPASG